MDFSKATRVRCFGFPEPRKVWLKEWGLAGVWGTGGNTNRFCPALQARALTTLHSSAGSLQLELPKVRAKPPLAPFSSAEGRSGNPVLWCLGLGAILWPSSTGPPGLPRMDLTLSAPRRKGLAVREGTLG